MGLQKVGHNWATKTIHQRKSFTNSACKGFGSFQIYSGNASSLGLCVCFYSSFQYTWVLLNVLVSLRVSPLLFLRNLGFLLYSSAQPLDPRCLQFCSSPAALTHQSHCLYLQSLWFLHPNYVTFSISAPSQTRQKPVKTKTNQSISGKFVFPFFLKRIAISGCPPLTIMHCTGGEVHSGWVASFFFSLPPKMEFLFF